MSTRSLDETTERSLMGAFLFIAHFATSARESVQQEPHDLDELWGQVTAIENELSLIRELLESARPPTGVIG